MKREHWKKAVAWILMIVFMLSDIPPVQKTVIPSMAQEKYTMEEERIQVSLGGEHSGAIKEDGSLWMWGSNSWGKLGNGTITHSKALIKIMENVKSISLGGYHSGAIKEDGSLWMWGWNDEGQLADGTTYYNSPAPIKIMEKVKSISLGRRHSGAIKEDGSLWMWGLNSNGQLGNGTETGSNVPIKIMENVKSISLGSSHSGAIKEDGSLWMWGNNGNGQLGNGTETGSSVPIKIMDNVKSISLGDSHSGAIKEDGSLWMWGSNSNGQLGNGTKTGSTVPIKIMEKVKSISLGSYHHSGAIKEDGSLWMWGYNTEGQLGNGTRTDSLVPIKIMEKVKSISLGWYHSGAIKEDGSLWLWGSNVNGQLGNQEAGNLITTPQQIMPPGSIFGAVTEDTNTFPISVEHLSTPGIKVIDAFGRPIADANISYQGSNYPTTSKGTVSLPDYTPGKPLEISKDNYETKRIDAYFRGSAGYDTFVLEKRGSVIQKVVMRVNNTTTDLSAKEATINTYYKTTRVSIQCTGNGQVAFYELYSGDKWIAQSDTGQFDSLSYGNFTAGKEVVLKALSASGQLLESKRLNLKVINVNPKIMKFSMGEGFSVEIPNSSPLLGGMKFEVDLGSFPITADVSGDGTTVIGINITELIKKDKKWLDTLKRLKPENFSNFFSAMKKADKKRKKSGKFEPELEVIGYLESNAMNPDYMKGKLFVELSGDMDWEYQVFPLGVPCVVEVSVSGKVNADGSLTFAVEEGFSGALSVGGEFGAGLYGGVGIAKWLSAGIYGQAALGLQYDIFPEVIRGLNQLYLKGEAGLKLKVFGKNAGKFMLIDGEYYFIHNDTAYQVSTLSELRNGVTIDNDAIYKDMERHYLYENESRNLSWSADIQGQANGNLNELILQDNTYQDIIPKVVETENTKMLFYLTDGGLQRADGDRSQLVYSVYNDADNSWSTPLAVLEDGTADFSPDVYVLEDKVYVIWQNGEGSLEGDLTLNDIADRLTLHAAVYHEATGTFTDLGSIEGGNGLLQQRPQIVADPEKVTVYWYENPTDNVLGLSGNNWLYRSVMEQSSLGQWNMEALGQESQCILSADGAVRDGEATYAYAAGTVDELYNTKESRVVLVRDNGAVTLDSGKLEGVAFTSLFGEETLTWYKDGDIRYMKGEADIGSFFGESRLSHPRYRILTDRMGNPEILFPMNEGGKSDLYRIGYRNGEFLEAVAVTAQEDYIQNVDGFIEGDKTILVYNRMQVDENLEEVNNSLRTGVLEHDYHDIMVVSADAMVKAEETTGEKILEITARLHNNGTLNAEGLSLQLSKADDTVLETKPVDTVLAPGEEACVQAVFSLEGITEAADYTLTVLGAEETDRTNNSTLLHLGEVDFHLETEVMAVGDTRVLQMGIVNTGRISMGGRVSVCDLETGTEYCSSPFDPVVQGETVYVEVPVDKGIFEERDSLTVEILVTPENGETILRETAVIHAPTHKVSFITPEGVEEIYVPHGEGASFPENPVKDGEHFKGWYTAEDPTLGSLYTEETAITEEVVLHACFTALEQTVSLKDCAVAAIPAQIYTGKALKPSVTVKFGSVPLKPKTDYTVAYSDNKNQGTATVTITGKGKYTDSISRSFKILYPLHKASIKKISAVNYNGNSHTPSVEATYKGKRLDKNIDYTVSYSNNRNAGTATVTLTGKGRFTGTKTATFKIKGVNIAGMEFEKPENVFYGKNGLEPFVNVRTKDGTLLREGADYKAVYENTMEKGKASVTIIGNGNYVGTKKLTYKIQPKPITEEMILPPDSPVYTGAVIQPAVTVSDEGEELVLGKDYTVVYGKNKNAGTATVTIKGKGNYTGVVRLPFTIQRETLEYNPKISVQVSDMAYTGRELKPAVQVYAGTTKLSGKDYTVSYNNNTQLGEGTVTITGRGNYMGSISGTFRIVEKARLLSSLSIKKPGNYEYTGQAITPKLLIMDGAYQLVEHTDYELIYANNLEAGKASVTVKGIGSYAGSKVLTYKIIPKALAVNNTWTEGLSAEPVEKQNYTGYGLTPQVVIRNGDRLLQEGMDYKLSYKKNVNPGVATIVVKGIGNYKGTNRSLTFEIVTWDYSKLMAEIENQVYTGKALKPQVTFTLDGNPILLKEKKAVTIRYSNNKDAGKATVTITGKGHLSKMEPILLSFSIDKADLGKAEVRKIANQMLKGPAVKPMPKVKVGKNNLKPGRDFTVSYLRNGVKGEAEVILEGIGNYTGEYRQTFIVY